MTLSSVPQGDVVRVVPAWEVRIGQAMFAVDRRPDDRSDVRRLDHGQLRLARIFYIVVNVPLGIALDRRISAHASVLAVSKIYS